MTRTTSSGVRGVLLLLAVLIAASMAASVSMVVTKQANATVSFSDNFDRDGDTFVGPWSTKNACAADRLTTDSALKRAGSHSMKVTVKDGDGSPCTYTSNPRAQVEKAGLFADGSERWIGHSTFFPSNFPTIGSGHWLIFSSYGFRYPYNGSAPGKFHVKSGTSDVIAYGRDERYNRDSIWESKITKGQWTDLVVHIKFSTSESVGFVEIYKNGTKQTLKNGSTRKYYATLKPDQTGSGSWNLSQYRSKGAAAEITLHHDEVKVGQSYEEVAPAAGGSSPTTTTSEDTTAPTVATVSPAANATGVGRKEKVKAAFSESMDPSTLSKSTVKLVRSGTTTEVDATVSYDGVTKTVTLSPNKHLVAGAKYTAKVTVGAKDKAGNPLTSDKIWTFTVRS